MLEMIKTSFPFDTITYLTYAQVMILIKNKSKLMRSHSHLELPYAGIFNPMHYLQKHIKISLISRKEMEYGFFNLHSKQRIFNPIPIKNGLYLLKGDE